LATASNIFWIIVAFAAVIVWAFWYQTWAWHEARQMEKLDPCLDLIPHSLPDQSASREAAIKQVYFGYQFEVPFPGPETATTYSSTYFATATLVFHADYGVVFRDPEGQHNFIHDLTADGHRPNMKAFLGTRLGKDAARSDYDFLKSQLDTTPNQISPMHSKREAIQRLTLLRMKGAIHCSRKPVAFYLFQSQNLRCIQMGEPAVDGFIEVRCFNPGDQEFNFIFSVRKGSGLKLSQLDINRVIQTLRPVPAPTNQPKN